MAVKRIKNNVRNAKNALKSGYQEVAPIVEFIGDLALNNGQKKLAIAARNQLSRIDNAIDRLTADSGAMVPHVAGAPVSIGTRVSRVAPKFQSSGTGVTISHREFISYAELGNFTTVTFGYVNPFNPYLFPWLATIAGSYDSYAFQKVIFEYIPQCSTSTAGSVVLAWDPAASDYPAEFSSLHSMHSVSVAPWMPAKLSIGGCTPRLMGEQASSTSAAKDMYNHGQFMLGSLGTGTAGQLFVHYTVKLFNAQPTSGLSTVVDLGLPASNTVTTTFNVLDGFLTRASSNSIIVPSGCWKLDVGAVGTGITNVNTVVGSGCTATNPNDTYNTANTLGVNTMFIRSQGLSNSSLQFKTTYTTLSLFQVRLIRIDTASFATAGIFL